MIFKNEINTRYFILINLLKSFSNQEMEGFSHFVACSYFNTDKRVSKLLQVLIKNVLRKQVFDEARQTKVYYEVFGADPSKKVLIDEQQKKLLRTKMSLLTNLAKRFLTIEALEENPACKNELLNKKLLDKQQFRLSNRLTKKYQKDLNSQTRKGIEAYAFAFQVETGRMNYYYQTGTLIKEDNFEALISALDLYYLINKLTTYITILSVMNVTQKSYDLKPLKAITPLLALPQYENNPLIILCRTIIQLMEINDEKIYKQLLELLAQNDKVIPETNLIDFYNVACNYCARQLRLGKVEYHRKFFELYKIMDKKSLLMEKDYIQVTKLKNIVSLSCHVGEFNWATKIINKYFPFVKKEQQKSVYHFNLGAIAFYQLDFKVAISHLIRVDKVNLSYDLDARILLLKSYYQLDNQYDERTMQIFRSAERFVISNKSMPFSHKKSYKNFIQILINLYRVRHQVGKVTLEGAQKKMKKMEFVINKKWLLEKITEISKRH